MFNLASNFKYDGLLQEEENSNLHLDLRSEGGTMEKTMCKMKTLRQNREMPSLVKYSISRDEQRLVVHHMQIPIYVWSYLGNRSDIDIHMP